VKRLTEKEVYDGSKVQRLYMDARGDGTTENIEQLTKFFDKYSKVKCENCGCGFDDHSHKGTNCFGCRDVCVGFCEDGFVGEIERVRREGKGRRK